MRVLDVDWFLKKVLTSVVLRWGVISDCNLKNCSLERYYKVSEAKKCGL